jgi:hypothetical protein
MATRSSIAVVLNDGSVKSIYCHFDGNVGYNGKYLRSYYNTYEQALELVEQGDMSSLNETIEESKFYARDRGEELVVRTYPSLDFYLLSQDYRQEYDYIFNEGQWFLINGGSLFDFIVEEE